MGEYIPVILFGLLNLFLRVDPKSGFIPSFRNILIDPKTMELHLNLFSFAGIEMFSPDGEIYPSEAK